jgi:hypothetical protein
MIIDQSQWILSTLFYSRTFIRCSCSAREKVWESQHVGTVFCTTEYREIQDWISWKISYFIVPNANHAIRFPRISVCILRWWQMRFNRVELAMRIAQGSEKEFQLITDYNITMLYQMYASLFFFSVTTLIHVFTLHKNANKNICLYLYSS